VQEVFLDNHLHSTHTHPQVVCVEYPNISQVRQYVIIPSPLSVVLPFINRAVSTGFDLPQQQWSLLNHLRTEQGHCGACRRKWRLTDTDLCPCGETQTCPGHAYEKNRAVKQLIFF